MSGGQKPDVSIYVKPAGSKDKSDRRYILSGWVADDQPRIKSLKLDRSVKAMKVQFDDGEVVTIKKGADGKMSHFIDIFLRDGTYGDAPAQQQDIAFGADDDEF